MTAAPIGHRWDGPIGRWLTTLDSFLVALSASFVGEGPVDVAVDSRPWSLNDFVESSRVTTRTALRYRGKPRIPGGSVIPGRTIWAAMRRVFRFEKGHSAWRSVRAGVLPPDDLMCVRPMEA